MLTARRRMGWSLALALGLASPFALPSEAQAQQSHHGLYVRVAAGGSYFSDSVESEPLPIVGTVDGTLKGGAFSTQIGVGGSISPGFVLGGMILFNHMPS